MVGRLRPYHSGMRYFVGSVQRFRLRGLGSAPL